MITAILELNHIYTARMKVAEFLRKDPKNAYSIGEIQKEINLNDVNPQDAVCSDQIGFGYYLGIKHYYWKK